MNPAAIETSAQLVKLLDEPLTIPAPAPGIYPNVPFNVYLAWDAASNSRLGKLGNGGTPAHLLAYLRQPPEESEALKVGRAIHVAVLEPDDFEARYLVAGVCSAIKKGDKLPCTNNGTVRSDGQWYCGTHARGLWPDNDAPTVLPSKQYQTCVRIRENMLARKATSGLIRAATMFEVSVVWVDEVTGVTCKARFDLLAPAFSCMADVKSTGDASKSAFEKSIDTYGYAKQGNLYLRGARTLGIAVEHYVMIAAEKEEPCAVADYRLLESALFAVDEDVTSLLKRYGECMASGEFPAYPDVIEDISLPAYRLKQIADAQLREMMANEGKQ